MSFLCWQILIYAIEGYSQTGDVCLITTYVWLQKGIQCLYLCWHRSCRPFCFCVLVVVVFLAEAYGLRSECQEPLHRQAFGNILIKALPSNTGCQLLSKIVWSRYPSDAQGIWGNPEDLTLIAVFVSTGCTLSQGDLRFLWRPDESFYCR